MINKKKFRISNDKKVLHKIGKRWVTVSALTLALLGGGAVASTTITHADTTTPTVEAQDNVKNKINNNLDKSYNNTQSSSNSTQFSKVAKPSNIQSQASNMHHGLMLNATNASTAKSNANNFNNTPANRLVPVNSSSSSAVSNKASNNNSVSNSSTSAKTNTISAPINQKTSFNSAYQSMMAQMSITDSKVASANAGNVQSDNKDIKEPLLKYNTQPDYFSGKVTKTSNDLGLNYKVYANGGVEFTNGTAQNDLDIGARSGIITPQARHVISSAKAIKFDNGINTSKVTNAVGLLAYCENLQYVDFGNNFNTSNVTDMESLLARDKNIRTVIFSNSFNTSNVTNMGLMFGGLISLKILTLPSSFDTSNVTNMNGMFRRPPRFRNNPFQLTIQSSKTKFNQSADLPTMYKELPQTDANGKHYTLVTPNDFSQGNVGTFVTYKNPMPRVQVSDNIVFYTNRNGYNVRVGSDEVSDIEGTQYSTQQAFSNAQSDYSDLSGYTLDPNALQTITLTNSNTHIKVDAIASRQIDFINSLNNNNDYNVVGSWTLPQQNKPYYVGEPITIDQDNVPKGYHLPNNQQSEQITLGTNRAKIQVVNQQQNSKDNDVPVDGNSQNPTTPVSDKNSNVPSDTPNSNNSDIPNSPVKNSSDIPNPNRNPKDHGTDTPDNPKDEHLTFYVTVNDLDNNGNLVRSYTKRMTEKGKTGDEFSINPDTYTTNGYSKTSSDNTYNGYIGASDLSTDPSDKHSNNQVTWNYKANPQKASIKYSDQNGKLVPVTNKTIHGHTDSDIPDVTKQTGLPAGYSPISTNNYNYHFNTPNDNPNNNTPKTYKVQADNQKAKINFATPSDKPVASNTINGDTNTSDTNMDNIIPSGYTPNSSDLVNPSKPYNNQTNPVKPYHFNGSNNQPRTIHVTPNGQSVHVHFANKNGQPLPASDNNGGNIGGKTNGTYTPSDNLIPKGYTPVASNLVNPNQPYNSKTNPIKPYKFTPNQNQSDTINVVPDKLTGKATVHLVYKQSNGAKITSDKTINLSDYHVGSNITVHPSDYERDYYDDNNNDWTIPMDWQAVTNQGQFNSDNDTYSYKPSKTFTYNATTAPDLIVRYVDIGHDKRLVGSDTYTAQELENNPYNLNWILGQTYTFGVQNGTNGYVDKSNGHVDIIHAPKGYHLVNNAQGFNYQNGIETMTLTPSSTTYTDTQGHQHKGLILMVGLSAMPNHHIQPTPASSGSVTPASNSAESTSTSEPSSASISMNSNEISTLASEIGANIIVKPNITVRPNVSDKTINNTIDNTTLDNLANDVSTDNQEISSLTNKQSNTSASTNNDDINSNNQATPKKIINLSNRLPMKNHYYVYSPKNITLYGKHGAIRINRHKGFTGKILKITKFHGKRAFVISWKHKKFTVIAKHTRNAYIQPKEYKRYAHGIIKHVTIKLRKNAKIYKSVNFNKHTFKYNAKADKKFTVVGIKSFGERGYERTRFILSNGLIINANKNYVKFI